MPDEVRRRPLLPPRAASELTSQLVGIDALAQEQKGRPQRRLNHFPAPQMARHKSIAPNSRGARGTNASRPLPQIPQDKKRQLHALERRTDSLLAPRADRLEAQQRLARMRQWLGTGASRLVGPCAVALTAGLSAELSALALSCLVGASPWMVTAGALFMLGTMGLSTTHYFRAVWHAVSHANKSHDSLRSHVTLGATFGMGLSPLAAGAGLLVASPASIAAASGLFLLSTISLWGPSPGCLPSVMDVGLSSSACLLGSTPWLLLLGISAADAAFIGVSLATGALALSAMSALLMQLVARSAPTPMADVLTRDPREVQSCRFEKVMLGSQAASLVDTPPELMTVAARLRQAVESSREAGHALRGMVITTLFGPPGTGKTVSAFGLAQAIGGDVAVTSASELEDKALAPVPVAFVRLVRLLLEANDRGRRLGRTQVVFVDEFDDLFAQLDPRFHAGSEYYALAFKMLTSVLGLIAQGECHITIMMATNNLTSEVSKLLSMITTRAPIYVGPMTPVGATRLTKLQLDKLEARANKKFGSKIELLSDGQEIDKLVAMLVAKNASGRHLRYPLAMALNQVTHSFWTHIEAGKKREDFDFHTSLADKLLFYASQIDASAKPRSQGQGSEGQNPTHSPIEHITERMGMQRMSYVEAILNIVEKFWQGYVTDPETSLALNMFGAELTVILLRVSGLYIEQIAAPQAPRDLNDVPLTQPYQSAGTGGPEVLLAPIAEALKTTFSLGVGARLRH